MSSAEEQELQLEIPPTPIDLYRGQLLPWHKHVLDEWGLSQYKVLDVGRKGRKTTFDVNELLNHALTDSKGLTYPIIGPSRLQEKEIVWDDHVQNALMQLARSGMRPGVDFQVNNSDLSVKFPGYGKFVVDGADNVESLRGKSDWGGVVLDEFASWKHKKYIWEEVIEPNLSVHEAWAIISSTPRGFEYFHRLMKYGDHENKIEGDAYDDERKRILPNKDFRSYRYTSYDNPYLSRTFLDGKKARLSTAAFNQEYMGRFEKFVGAIYKEFARETHVIAPFAIPQDWTHYRAMDFGGTNPTVCLWISVSPDNVVYVTDEYYKSGESVKFHAGVIKEKTRATHPIGITWGDPSGRQQMLDYAEEQLFITPAPRIYKDNEDWVISGINVVADAMRPDPQTGKPKVFFFSNCINLTREVENYHWLENRFGEITKEQPEKKDDHGVDALRYFFEGFIPRKTPMQQALDDRMEEVTDTNPFTGY